MSVWIRVKSRGLSVPAPYQLGTTARRLMAKWMQISNISSRDTKGECWVSHLTEGWVDSRAGLAPWGVENDPLTLPGIEPRPTSPQPVAIPTELSGSCESHSCLLKAEAFPRSLQHCERRPCRNEPPVIESTELWSFCDLTAGLEWPNLWAKLLPRVAERVSRSGVLEAVRKILRSAYKVVTGLIMTLQ